MQRLCPKAKAEPWLNSLNLYNPRPLGNLGSRALAFDETAAGLAFMGTFQTNGR